MLNQISPKLGIPFRFLLIHPALAFVRLVERAVDALVQRLDLVSHDLGAILQAAARASEGVADGKLRIGEALIEATACGRCRPWPPPGILMMDRDLVEPLPLRWLPSGSLNTTWQSVMPLEELLQVLDLLLDQLPDGIAGRSVLKGDPERRMHAVPPSFCHTC